MSGPLKDLLDKEIAAIEGEIGQTGHFSLGFGYDSYRKKEALDILVLGYRSVFDTSGGYVEAAVRIEGGARPDPVPAETRQIVPYIESEMPAGWDFAISNVITVKPERTFWEKVLFLHAMTEMTEKRNADQNANRKVQISCLSVGRRVNVTVPPSTVTSER